MKQILSEEFRRMQKLAGIITEDESNEDIVYSVSFFNYPEQMEQIIYVTGVSSEAEAKEKALPHTTIDPKTYETLELGPLSQIEEEEEIEFEDGVYIFEPDGGSSVKPGNKRISDDEYDSPEDYDDEEDDDY